MTELEKQLTQQVEQLTHTISTLMQTIGNPFGLLSAVFFLSSFCNEPNLPHNIGGIIFKQGIAVENLTCILILMIGISIVILRP